VELHLSSLEEGCCEILNELKTIDFDEYKKDKTIASVDRILECNDKYIFIEEKSFLLDYFRLAGKESKSPFIPENGIIRKDFLELISKLDVVVKEKLFYKAMAEKTLSSTDKIKDTVYTLCKDDNFCDAKVKNAKTIYLYCKTGTPADKIASLIFNSQKRKDKIIECCQLKRYLENNGCVDI